MSYTLKLKYSPDDLPVITLSGDVPAGEFEISGDDDGNLVSVHVCQRDPQGRFVVSAHHRRDRAEEALHDLEGHAEEAIAIVAE